MSNDKKEFNRSEWIKKKREDWPEGSKERSLMINFSGAKTVLQALENAKKTRIPDLTASQSPQKETVQDAMSKAVKAIELVYSSDFNLPETELKRLNALPLTTVEEINYWKDQWLKLLV